MIEIKKITDKDVAQKICATHNIDWCPEYHVIATIEQGEILHCAVFEYHDENGEIHAISGFDGDLLMLDGLCRAILNIMDINGVKYVYLPSKYDKLANKIGFTMQNDRYHLSLEGFFKCCCHETKGESNNETK